MKEKQTINKAIVTKICAYCIYNIEYSGIKRFWSKVHHSISFLTMNFQSKTKRRGRVRISISTFNMQWLYWIIIHFVQPNFKEAIDNLNWMFAHIFLAFGFVIAGENQCCLFPHIFRFTHFFLSKPCTDNGLHSQSKKLSFHKNFL